MKLIVRNASELKQRDISDASQMPAWNETKPSRSSKQIQRKRLSIQKVGDFEEFSDQKLCRFKEKRQPTNKFFHVSLNFKRNIKCHILIMIVDVK